MSSSIYQEILQELNVSRETQEAIEGFVLQLAKWQKSKNLVSKTTLSEVWTRHIADSMQMALFEPLQSRQQWLDMGAGAGFPSLILGFLAKDKALTDWKIQPVEANYKKCAFMREVARLYNLPVDVRCARLENASKEISNAADYITARALAPLDQLLDWGAPYLKENGQMILLKGKAYQEELKDAGKKWHFELETMQSMTDPEAAILRLSAIAPKI